jgi:type III secretion protein T
MDWLGEFSGQVLLLAIAATRVAACFLVLPAFAPETVPPLVRNSIFMSLGLVVFLVQPAIAEADLNAFTLIFIFTKEAAIGLAIGMFFAIFLWALETAGRIIDGQIGMAMAQIVDPLTGHQTSLTGSFLARLANFVFMFAGGLMLVMGVLLESYGIWPVMSGVPHLERAGAILFASEFQRLMTLAVMFAAPALIILLTVDLSLGLVNRFAQQLNVFSLSLSIKAWLATAIVLMLLGSFIRALIADLEVRPDTILDALRSLV